MELINDQQLKDSEHKYRNLVENSLVGVFSSKINGEILFVNDAIRNMLEFDSDEELKNLGAFVRYKFPEERENLLSLLKIKGRVKSFEATILTKNGFEHVFLMNVVQIGDILEGTLVDITERRQIEREITESQQFLKTITAEVQAVIFAFDKNGIFTFSDGKGLQTIGLKPGQVVGSSVYEVYKDFPEIIEAVKKSLNGILVKTQALEVGNMRFDTTYQPIFDRKGKVISVVGLAIDVTEAIKAEKALNEHAIRLQSLLELNQMNTAKLESQYALLNSLINSPGDIIIFSLDNNYCYTTFNENHRLEMKKIWGTDIQIGTNLLDCMHDAEIRKLAKISIDRTLSGEMFSEIQYQPHADIYYEFNWNPILHGHVVTGVTIFIRNVTARIKAEKELQLRNEQLLESNAEKDKFFSIIAHDLKGPFNTLLGFSEILAENVQQFKPEQIQEMANIIYSSAGNLFTLLENLLEWSRMKRGQVSFKPDKCNICDVVNQNTEIHRLQAEKKGLSIINSIPHNTFVKADLQMVNGIIRNLLSNAIKFSHAGGTVTITSELTKDQTLVFSISDKGIGIPVEMKEKLFVLGAESSRKGTNGEPSTGLGLLLCKEYIEKHNGNLWVESEVPKGSTFYFTLNYNDK